MHCMYKIIQGGTKLNYNCSYNTNNNVQPGLVLNQNLVLNLRFYKNDTKR